MTEWLNDLAAAALAAARKLTDAIGSRRDEQIRQR